jgi:hypothetical protein
MFGIRSVETVFQLIAEPSFTLTLAPNVALAFDDWA